MHAGPQVLHVGLSLRGGRAHIVFERRDLRDFFPVLSHGLLERGKFNESRDPQNEGDYCGDKTGHRHDAAGARTAVTGKSVHVFKKLRVRI